MVKAVFIDIDNTLYAYDPCHAAGIDQAWSVAPTVRVIARDKADFIAQYDSARQMVQRRVGDVAASHCRLLYFKTLMEKQSGTGSLDTVMRLHSAYWEGYFSKLVTFPHCKEVISDVKTRGIPVVWISNFTTERQILKLKALGLDDVGILVTSEEAGRDKPAPDIFLLALEKLQLHPEEVILVGDDWKRDILPATTLGFHAIWLDTGGKDSARKAGKITYCLDWEAVGLEIERLVPKTAVLPATKSDAA